MCAGKLGNTGAAVFPSMNASPFMVPHAVWVGKKNRRAISCCRSPTMCRTALRLSARHSNTLLSLRTAAMIRGPEGCLGDPGDGRGTVAVFAARGQYIDAIRQHPERFLSDFRIHRRHLGRA